MKRFAERLKHHFVNATKNGTYVTVARTVKKEKLLQLSLLVMLALVFCALFADFISPYGYAQQDLNSRLAPPNLSHLLGTDMLGRDLLSRMIFGTRLVMYEVSATLAIALTIGVILGLVSGFYGGIVDSILMRGVDVLLAFPSILVAISVAAILGTGLNNMILAVSISQIGPYARLVRGQVFSIKEATYVEAARMMGASSIRLIFRHILPNTTGPLIVQATFSLATALLAIASLGFIGLGAQPPTPEWGALIYESRIYLFTSAYPVLVPGIAIVILAFAFNVIGENLRDIMDPRRLYL